MVLQNTQSRIHRTKIRNKFFLSAFIFCWIRIRNNNSRTKEKFRIHVDSDPQHHDRLGFFVEIKYFLGQCTYCSWQCTYRRKKNWLNSIQRFEAEKTSIWFWKDVTGLYPIEWPFYPTTLLEKILVDFAVYDWWRFCKALCDVKFRQLEGKGRTFRHIEVSNSVMI